MGRTMSESCPTCGFITDWGDFGAEDGSSKSQCICPPLDAIHLTVNSEEFSLLLTALYEHEDQTHRMAYQVSPIIGEAAKPIYQRADLFMALVDRLQSQASCDQTDNIEPESPTACRCDC